MKRKREQDEFSAEEKYKWFNAVMNGYMDFITKLLDEGFDVNTIIKIGDPRPTGASYTYEYLDGALVMAAQYGNIELIELLLSRGADRSKLNRALFKAVIHNQWYVIKYFKEQIAEGNISPNEVENGVSLISLAATHSLASTLRILLSMFEDIDPNFIMGIIRSNRDIISTCKGIGSDGFKSKNEVLLGYISNYYFKYFSDFDFLGIENNENRGELIKRLGKQKNSLAKLFEKIFCRAVSPIKVTKDIVKYFNAIPKSLISFINADLWGVVLEFLDDSDGAKFIEDLMLEKSKKIECKKDSDMVSVVQLLANQDLVLKDVPKDGNCFFHAIAPHLGVDQSEIRDRVVLHINNHQSLYSGFIVNGFEEFIARAAREGEWAGNELIQAAANHFGLRIVINQLRGPVLTIEGMGANLQEVQVLYTGNHYMALVREETPAASNFSILELEAVMPEVLGEGVSAVFDSNLDHLS